jgi:hypothetical protein
LAMTMATLPTSSSSLASSLKGYSYWFINALVGMAFFLSEFLGGHDCNIPSFYIKFWNKKINLFVLIEISQGIKTFWVYLEVLLEKLFRTFYYSLNNSFEKIEF